MLRFIKNRPLFIIILVSIVLVALMVVTTKHEQAIGKIEGPLVYIISPIQKAFYTVSSGINNFFYTISDKSDLRVENRELL